MKCVISESCFKGTILQRNFRKMTIKWPFSYNSFVKFHGKEIWEPQHDCFITICVIIRCVIKGCNVYCVFVQVQKV